MDSQAVLEDIDRPACGPGIQWDSRGWLFQHRANVREGNQPRQYKRPVGLLARRVAEHGHIINVRDGCVPRLQHDPMDCVRLTIGYCSPDVESTRVTCVPGI